MMNAAATTLKKCECGQRVPDHVRYCVFCTEDAGAPNVRIAEAELPHLMTRWAVTGGRAKRDGVEYVLRAFHEAIARSQVVVSRNAENLYRDLCTDQWLLAKFKEPIGLMLPMRVETRRQRAERDAADRFWPGFANDLTFGVLTLNGKGPQHHGDYHVVLNDRHISKRATFLEEGASGLMSRYDFGEDGDRGFRACWETRHLLAETKFYDKIIKGLKEADFASALLGEDCPGESGTYIEAQIFGLKTLGKITDFSIPPPSMVDLQFRELIDKMLTLMREGAD